MAKMTTAEAKDHTQALVTKFARPLLHLDDILSAAIAAEQETKEKTAEITKLNAALANARTQLAAFSDRITTMRQQADEETQRADAAIREAKGRQQEAEARAAEVLEHIDAMRRRAQADAAKDLADYRVRLEQEIKELEGTKAEIETHIQTFHERFAR